MLLADTSARKELDQRLAHASKMESIGRLAGGIAHDFNNLLLVMRSHASLLRERLGDIVATELDEVERAADDAGRLVRQLLAFSRNRDVEPTILDANVVLARVESMLRPLMHEDIELVRTPSVVPDGAGRPHAGRAHRRQPGAQRPRRAARGRNDHRRHGSRGTGRRALGRPARDRHRHGHGRRDSGAHLRALLHHEGRAVGTGLGLFIVNELVEHAGGAIEMSSAPGRGTNFSVYLPYVEHMVDDALVPVPVEPVLDEEALTKGMETVLIADDEDDVRESIREALEHYGYTVLTAGDPTTALLLAQRNAEDLDLVLTDLVMPDMNGRELSRRLAAIAPDLPVIYMSGQSDGTQLSEQGAVPRQALLAPRARVQDPRGPQGREGDPGQAVSTMETPLTSRLLERPVPENVPLEGHTYEIDVIGRSCGPVRPPTWTEAGT